jgi:DNA-binding NarL/FixJ family response regulator
MKPPLKILLVGDHLSGNDKMVEILQSMDAIEIVGYVSNGEDAINAYSDLDPDVIFIDVIMEGMTGLEAARWIKEQNNDVQIVLLSEALRKEFLYIGTEMELDGYLPKGAQKSILSNAIERLKAGKRYFDFAIKALVFCREQKEAPGRLTYCLN